MEVEEFDFDFDAFERYAWLTAWLPWFGRWYMAKRREVTRCWLDGDTLRVDKGVLFLCHHAVPVSKICDILLIQGPWMARYGLWNTIVKTGNAWATVSLLGLKDPEGFRDRLLQASAGAARAKGGAGDPAEAD